MTRMRFDSRCWETVRVRFEWGLVCVLESGQGVVDESDIYFCPCKRLFFRVSRTTCRRLSRASFVLPVRIGSVQMFTWRTLASGYGSMVETMHMGHESPVTVHRTWAR